MKRRVFAAIDISDDARRAAAEYVSRLRDEFPNSPVRWERQEKLHLTVKFAGSLDEDQLAIFTERVSVAAKSVDPFRLALAGTGAFIKRRGPSALWFGVEQMATDNDRLGKLPKMLTGGDDARAFNPHITIARIKDTKQAKDLIEKHDSMAFGPIEFEVNEILIYESVLSPSGSVYSNLEAFPLGC